ncbi:MAG: hypothetical protein JWO94_2296 [Verrucomicrobiaceae bacterium]|nr:hypothetical protein [Verrucomicrobiaceae bacterium]
MKFTTLLPCILAGCTLSLQAGTPAEAVSAKDTKQVYVPPIPASWKDKTISPVADLIFFEDPIVHSEITPVFMYHDIDSDFPLTGGGHSEIYGARVQFAVTPRLGIFLSKGGYMDIHPGNGGKEFGGWADTGFGVKYMAIDDEADQFVLTPGIGYTPPWGDKTILFGHGNGEWNFFTSAEKGFGDFHLTARVGLRLPNDTQANSTFFHYGVQADYYFCRYFIPFVSGVGYTVVNAGNSIPIDAEGADSQNFGSSLSQGNTQFLIGAGFRSKITDTIDIGVAYQKGVVKPYGTFDDRVTVAVQFKF